MKRTKNPAPTATGSYATATLVEWIGLQACHTPKRLQGKYLEECEGDLDGVTYCWRHDMSWEHAKRLLRWQVRRPALSATTYRPFCGTCRDTGRLTDDLFGFALHVLNVRPGIGSTETCPDCPRCVVCCVEASLHSEEQEERCAQELAEYRDELLPERFEMYHWLPQSAQE